MLCSSESLRGAIGKGEEGAGNQGFWNDGRWNDAWKWHALG